MVSKVLSNEQVTELYKIEDADHTKKYASLAPELMPSVEGLLELFTQESMDMDELGRQARAEFWYRAHDEFQNIRKHKVVQRF